MKIKVLIPNAGMDRETLNAREAMLSRAVSPGTELSADCISAGPEAIESVADEYLAAPLLMEAARRAEQEGYDAFVVYCFSDPAVDALRELLSIPVVGPGEVSLAAAGILSNRFSVLTTVEKNIARTLHRLQKHPASAKMASIRALNMPVLALREDPDATCRYLEEACRLAVEEDGADTVILGCLGMAQYGDILEQKFGIKVIDPAFLAVAQAELAARLHLCPSRRACAAYEKGLK